MRSITASITIAFLWFVIGVFGGFFELITFVEGFKPDGGLIGCPFDPDQFYMLCLKRGVTWALLRVLSGDLLKEMTLQIGDRYLATFFLGVGP